MTWDPTKPATGSDLLSAEIRDNFAALDALMTGGGGVTFPLLAPDGSAAAPSYAFAGSTGAGLYRIAGPSTGLSAAGLPTIAFNYDNLGHIKLRGDTGGFGWAPAAVLTDGPDLLLTRDGPGILAQKNGAALQKLRVYGDATHYVELSGVAGLTAPVVIGTGVSAIVALTQAAYDALTPKVATTLYVITP